MDREVYAPALMGVREARAAIESLKLQEPRSILLPVWEAAWRILAEDLIAPRNVPERPVAAMDGYAVSFRVASNKKRLEVGVDRGAVWVETGDELPSWADTVVRKEASRVVDEGLVEVVPPSREWENVIIPGEFVREGALIASRGEVLTPSRVSLILQSGIRISKVYELTTSIIPVGSEIEPVGSLKPGVMDYITPMVAGMVSPWSKVRVLPPVPDEEARLAKMLVEASMHSDVVITIGGASVGEKDMVKKVVARHGQIIVPGFGASVVKRGGLGVVNGRLVAMLPGQCVSAALSLHETLFRAFKGFTGRPLVRTAYLPLAETFKLERRMPSAILFKLGRGGLEPLEWGVGLCRELVKADAYAILEPGSYRQGEILEVTLLSGGAG